jgi:hypothetical protein
MLWQHLRTQHQPYSPVRMNLTLTVRKDPKFLLPASAAEKYFDEPKRSVYSVQISEIFALPPVA